MEERHQSTAADWRALVLAPLPPDARALCRTLRRAGFHAHPCRDLPDLCDQLGRGGAAIILCEEALQGGAGADELACALAAQPEWSGPPILVIGTRGPACGHGWRRLQQARGGPHTLLLPRPITTAALVATVHAALHCRARQYRVRDELDSRRKAEEHLRLISAEMDHRLRNTLAMVESLIRQSARHAMSVDEFCEVFRDRLRSFSRAHSILMRSQWQGMTVEDIIESELTPRLESRERFSVSGPRITLPPRAALALYMAVHELATNAAKYGAASNDEGRIDVSWRLSHATELELHWRESGGPRVSPPRRTGFGTRLIGRLVEHELGGSIQTDFAPEGLTCRMQLPLPPRGGGASAPAEAALLASIAPS